MTQNTDITRDHRLEKKVLDALEEVKDPEIPAISVVDLGIIIDVKATKDGEVTIRMTPTFSGCPALQLIQYQVRKKARETGGVKNAEVEVDFDTQWTSNRISEKGRKAIKKFGLAPPPRFEGDLEVETIINVACPFCDSNDTILKSAFGSTLCRSIHFCNSCEQSFEQFKPL
jgi:ring-1,2-phenylacetyl-CoA epoxidase subunit PaaD